MSVKSIIIIMSNKRNYTKNQNVKIVKANAEQIEKILKRFKFQKCYNPDLIPIKIVQLSANINDLHSAKVANRKLLKNQFPKENGLCEYY